MSGFLKILKGALVSSFLMSCTGDHLITDKDYRKKTENYFNERKLLAENRNEELFSVFEKELSMSQSEALKFLFAYMPLNDLADHTGDFFLANADKALISRKMVPWGGAIPEDIFLHYVLPCRVNNENLDSFRIAYFDEIHERIKGKHLTEAALEINYWCQEKVTYQPADIRTSAPMSTILSARGRCGEESTLTVAALRTAGIPARQVYTPRWAHTDDNHAWVEVWIDGEWYYMGACEPEPVLDRGWFTEPARRAMLVHTKSFGAPIGYENFINIHRNFTEVNNLSEYAATKRIFVKVLGNEGLPEVNATVDYQLYNYAEFYPLASVTTNTDGISSFETGLGDLLLWAYKDGQFAWEKISVSRTDTLVLILKGKGEESYSVDLDFDVPPVLPPLPGPSAEMIEINAQRINKGNEIRVAYVDSWIKPAEVTELAVRLSLDVTKASGIFARSMGNYREIRQFLISVPDSMRNIALSMLEILPDKDLRDTRSEILTDHLIYSIGKADIEEIQSDKMFIEFVLNPRVANEMLVPWRGYFRNAIPPGSAESAVQDPSFIINFLNENITIASEENYYKTPISPIGVYELRFSDEESRSICFVAMCRSLGIPARLEPGRNIPQYWHQEKWNDVFFADQFNQGSERGYLRLTSSQKAPVPGYYSHFTLAKFENGKYETLEYGYNKKITEFAEEIELPAGSYMLVTGNRLNDSKILARLSFFELAAGEHKTLDVELRQALAPKNISGKMNFDNIAGLFPGSDLESVYSKGAVIAWIDPDQEPTKHVLNDLQLFRNELDKWGGHFLFLSEKRFNHESLKGLPENSHFSTDKSMAAFRKSVAFNSLPDLSLPVIILSDKSGNILFSSSGYRIGIGGEIVKFIR